MSINLNQVSVPLDSTRSNQQVGKGTSIWQKEISLFGQAFGNKNKAEFYKSLETLLVSGLDLQRSLTLIAKNEPKKNIQLIIQSLLEKIEKGFAFSEALQKDPSFTEFEIYSIHIGEESGQLLEVLQELSNYYTKAIKYRQQFVGALAYPVFVIGFAILVIVFLLNFLVPMFSSIYARFDGQLPAITQSIVDLSDWLSANGFLLVLVVTAISGLLYYYRNTVFIQKNYARLILRTPVFGGIIKHIYLSRLSQSLYLLTRSKVPILHAVGHVKRMIPFYPIATSLAATEKDILNGELLNYSLRKSSFYPPQFIALLEVGEETGQLEQIFQRLQSQYNDQVEYKTSMIGSLIEPILIISLGVLVGFILVAMYLPLFQLSVSAGG